MDLKVIFDVIPEHMEKLTVKHVNQRRCEITYAIQSGEKIRQALHPKGRKSTPYM